MNSPFSSRVYFSNYFAIMIFWNIVRVNSNFKTRSMTEYSLTELGKRVKEIRKSLRLSQREFSSKIDLSPSFVSELESGKFKPGYDFFFKAALVYDVNLYYLILGVGDMFGEHGAIPSLGDNEFGSPIEDVNQLLWYVGNSTIVKHSVMSFVTKFLIENEEIIRREVERKN